MPDTQRRQQGQFMNSGFTSKRVKIKAPMRKAQTPNSQNTPRATSHWPEEHGGIAD